MDPVVLHYDTTATSLGTIFAAHEYILDAMQKVNSSFPLIGEDADPILASSTILYEPFFFLGSHFRWQASFFSFSLLCYMGIACRVLEHGTKRFDVTQRPFLTLRSARPYIDAGQQNTLSYQDSLQLLLYARYNKDLQLLTGAAAMRRQAVVPAL